jgi:hypothetical protein
MRRRMRAVPTADQIDRDGLVRFGKSHPAYREWAQRLKGEDRLPRGRFFARLTKR